MKYKQVLLRFAEKIYLSGLYERAFLNSPLQKDYLKQLNPGESADVLIKRYHLQKVYEFLIGILICILCFVMGIGWYLYKKEDAQITWQKRPDYFEGDTQETWIVRRSDGTTEEVSINVSEQIYKKEEVQMLFDKTMELLDEMILGKNQDENHVVYPLKLPTFVSETNVSIQWISDRPDIMSSHGEILPEHEAEVGEVVQMKGILQCQAYEAVYIRDFHVFPAKVEGDGFWIQTQRVLEKLENASREEEGFQLPNRVNGENVVFLKKEGGELLGLCFVAFLIPILLYVGKDEKLAKKAMGRKEQLLADYPELVSKVSILMGAGMTSRTAIRRIAADYIKRKKQTGNVRYAYEELLITCHEIDNGGTEESAYEHYGKRCGVLPYMRLGGLLAGNLKNGNKNLLDSLSQEAEEAYEERKRRARKAGEEAGTKMLGPMMLMLVVTILIILYPAFTSFQL